MPCPGVASSTLLRRRPSNRSSEDPEPSLAFVPGHEALAALPQCDTAELRHARPHRGTSQPVSAQASLSCEENATGESRMSCCACTPSAGPRPLSAGIRSCVVARPRDLQDEMRRGGVRTAAASGDPRHQRRRIRREQASAPRARTAGSDRPPHPGPPRPAIPSATPRDPPPFAAAPGRAPASAGQAADGGGAMPSGRPRCSGGTARPGRRR